MQIKTSDKVRYEYALREIERIINFDEDPIPKVQKIIIDNLPEYIGSSDINVYY
ncbi:hypothetical protein Bcell_2089 [Evansella cellulosilytica DSM 2522]|uniref:Uncharacterized protein n=1 Tax=Evansella cellulosilytica (strain ATCC 21833 / DSM 2522 / FERM P-1141 / JCM 9156 / N-4) TaxID=649639 RepID=E6U1I7_EVAC2|nr:hypothetical protein Bcell_2089 [Evansella cellulosilytica DSM 2522]